MTAGSRFTDSHARAVPARGVGWAPRAEVARWAAVAALVAIVLLGLVAVVAARDSGAGGLDVSSGLLVRHHTVGDLWYVFRRNLLVLGIHLCACWIGAIVGREHRPAPARLGRVGALHRPVPGWMGRASLFYALLVTLLSVAVQAIALGRLLADLSVATGVSRDRLLLLVLPHAAPELVAVFLPLGLFLTEARRGRLDRLGPWSLQAAAIALPVLLCAAAIETYVTPGRVIAATHITVPRAGPSPARAAELGRRSPTRTRPDR